MTTAPSCSALAMSAQVLNPSICLGFAHMPSAARARGPQNRIPAKAASQTRYIDVSTRVFCNATGGLCDPARGRHPTGDQTLCVQDLFLLLDLERVVESVEKAAQRCA